MSAAARVVTPLILFAVLVISFAGAIVFGFVQLLWLGQPLGGIGETVSFICLYVFSADSLALLIFDLREQAKPAV
jgi:hypothetical protein